MTISGYQSYSYAAIQMRVTVTAGAKSTEGSAVPAPTPAADTPAPSRAARRADALFTALDGDNDGAISEDEFKDGALNLLRNAGARRRIDEDGDQSGRSPRGLGRLERKLERVFERADVNDDGAIDKDELTAALTRGKRRGGADGPPPPEAPLSTDAAAGATVVSFSVTFVSVAVQRYTSLQNTAGAEVPVKSADTEPAKASETESSTSTRAA